MEYKKEPAFVNRQQEINYLKDWIEQRPEHILFLYGPKSSGKTTLMYKFVESVLNDESKFSVKLFNLRKILIVNYDDFLQRFFTIEEPHEKESTQTRQYNLKVFKLTVKMQEKIKKKQLDPFDVMEQELKELNSKGIKPVIIIDELQALDFIYFNSQRELIKELINFFVAMTKESHLCHVLLASSDGYFIEKLYNDSKLRKTSELFEVDYLPEKDIIYWLNNLEKESSIKDYILSKSQIKYIWDHFGGSIWEISTLLGRFLKVCKNKKVEDKEMKKIIESYIIQARSYFEEFAGLKKQRKALLKIIDKNTDNNIFKEINLINLVEDGFYSEDNLRKELNYMVQQNYLYYNPTLAEYKLQGKSMKLGLTSFIQMFI